MGRESTGEVIFIKYAFPAIKYCARKISASKRDEFEEILRNNEVFSRQELEKLRQEIWETWPGAVKSMQQHLGTEEPEICWRAENVRDYWVNGHNRLAGNNVLCWVYWVEILDILPPREREICRVRTGFLYPATRDSVQTQSMRIPIPVKSYERLEESDRATMHALQIAEKPPQEFIDRYFKNGLKNENSNFW